MNRITTTTARFIATAALRQSWMVLSLAASIRLEAWENRVAVRQGVVDDMLQAVIAEAVNGR